MEENCYSSKNLCHFSNTILQHKLIFIKKSLLVYLQPSAIDEPIPFVE